MTAERWRHANRALWEQMVDHHLRAEDYDLAPLRAGRGRLHPIEEAELGPVAGKRILHLQCHFGRDSLILAQQGATVTGVDFSPKAIATARRLARELGLAERARFVECDVDEAPAAVAAPAAFDLVFASWGAIGWLPDIRRWAEVAAGFVAPGGALYLADAHPAGLIFDDAVPEADGRPGWYWPYFRGGVLIERATRDYAGERAPLEGEAHQWLHPLGDIVTAVIATGLRLAWLHEHDAVPWPMFACLVRGDDGLYRWPERAWLPLGFSLKADRPT